jgi:hypothetical protein
MKTIFGDNWDTSEIDSYNLGRIAHRLDEQAMSNRIPDRPQNVYDNSASLLYETMMYNATRPKITPVPEGLFTAEEQFFQGVLGLVLVGIAALIIALL